MSDTRGKGGRSLRPCPSLRRGQTQSEHASTKPLSCEWLWTLPNLPQPSYKIGAKQFDFGRTSPRVHVHCLRIYRSKEFQSLPD